MMQAMSMKQIGVRNLSCAVQQMEWSNKMDLIAYGNEKGEVIIQRLNWQKILVYNTPGDDVKVRSLSWQVDTTLLAVGYSNGKIALLDAETENLVFSIKYNEDIKKVCFSKPINIADYKSPYRNRTEISHEFFLPKLPSLNSVSLASKSCDEQKSFNKGAPCFLVVSLTNGHVHILLLGSLKTGTIDLTSHLANPTDFHIYDVRLSGGYDTIYALVRDGNQLKLLHFRNEVLMQYMSPLLNLAKHYSHILETKNYINETIQCMLEAWETVLMEMDNKLTKYANAQSEGALSADFLELLVFGYATHEIEEFLMDDLTEKGLKKLATSVDLSYSTIQNLITKPLHSAAINMFYFMNTVKGLSRINYYFEPFIDCEAAGNALRMCGAFLMKVLEMQQVIDQCVNDMKLFFCFLCIVIMRLHQQEVTEEIAQDAPEDTIYLAEYLNSFEDSVVANEDGTVTQRKFNLEKVGQYLENKNLQQISKADVHHLWSKLLEENDCLRNNTLLFPHEKHTSLLQQRDKMLQAVENVFERPNESISANFELKTTIICATLDETKSIENDFIHSSFFVNESTGSNMFATSLGSQELLILEFDKLGQVIKHMHISLQPDLASASGIFVLDNLRIVDLQCYNENIISLLLKNNSEQPRNYLLQFPLELVKAKYLTYELNGRSLDLTNKVIRHSIHNMVDANHFKSLDGSCTNLSVSGSRKVSTILSDMNRRMTIFEMEIEDDEDDTEISQTSFLESA